MDVTLKLGEPLSTLVGNSSAKVSLNGSNTVAAAFDAMDLRHPGFAAEVKRGEYDLPYNIFVNDDLVRWDKIAHTPLKDGDKIYLFLAVSGGCDGGKAKRRSLCERRPNSAVPASITIAEGA